jgi:hypothetical protein
MSDYPKMKDRKLDQTDRYTFIDGEEHHVDREGIKTRLEYYNHSFGLNYDLTKLSDYTFLAQLEGNLYDSPNRGHRQSIHETGKPSYYALKDYDVVIVSDHAQGADMLGERLTKEHGLKLEMYPADWKAHYRSAGFLKYSCM